jgi:hypothetical protein
MRWITPSLMALSLVFSTGGVAITGHADSAGTVKTPVTTSRSVGAKSAEQCAVPNSANRHTAATSHKRKAPLDSGKNTIVLNTTGYNYSTDGQWKGSPIGRPPQALPEGMRPKSAPPAPPAANEAK